MVYEFPNNMPAVWDEHFGRVPRETGVPIVIGAYQDGGFSREDNRWLTLAHHNIKKYCSTNKLDLESVSHNSTITFMQKFRKKNADEVLIPIDFKDFEIILGTLLSSSLII